MRKYGGLVALAALVVLALSACNQQPSMEPPPAKEFGLSVSAGQTLNGVTYISVYLPEDLRVTAEELKVLVDDMEVAKWTFTASSASVEPQALPFRFVLNTMACSTDFMNDDGFLDGGTIGCNLESATPLWQNGTHTLKAVLKGEDVGGPGKNTREVAVEVFFDNQDRVIFSVEGNHVTDAADHIWFGNDDVQVKMTVVNYTGADYSISMVADNEFKVTHTGGQVRNPDNFLPEYGWEFSTISPPAPVATVSGFDFTLPKADNPIEGEVEITVPFGYLLDKDGKDIPLTAFRLDNKAPELDSHFDYAVKFKRLYEVGFEDPDPAERYAHTTDVIHGFSDGGVGLDTVTATVESGLLSESFEVPGKLPVLANAAWTLKEVVAQDKLGNTRTVAPDVGFQFLAQTLSASGQLQITDQADSPSTSFAAGTFFKLRTLTAASGGFKVTPSSGSCTPTYFAYLAIKKGDDLIFLAFPNDEVTGATASANDNIPTVLDCPSNYAEVTGNTTAVDWFSAVPAIRNVDYVLVVMDDAGNFTTVPIAVTVTPGVDTEAPVLTDVTVGGSLDSRKGADRITSTSLVLNLRIADASQIAYFNLSVYTGEYEGTRFFASIADDNTDPTDSIRANTPLIPAVLGGLYQMKAQVVTADIADFLDVTNGWNAAPGAYDIGLDLENGTKGTFPFYYYAVDTAGNIGYLEGSFEAAVPW